MLYGKETHFKINIILNFGLDLTIILRAVKNYYFKNYLKIKNKNKNKRSLIKIFSMKYKNTFRKVYTFTHL